MSSSPLRVDYHMHTCFSYDSDAPLETVLERARAARIGRLCVTDHDTIEGALRLSEMAGDDIEIVVGCEFSTDEGSQVVGLYLPSMIHERRLPQLLRAIHEEGGKVLLPHPFRRGSGIFRHEKRRSEAFISEILAQTDLIEAYNGHDSYDNNAASHVFARDRRLPAVASSDAHKADEIGSVFVEYAVDAAVDGVSGRRIYFPDQLKRREHPIKRMLMEQYHRINSHLPAPVQSVYLEARRRYHRGRTSSAAARPARAQYDFTAVGATDERPS